MHVEKRNDPMALRKIADNLRCCDPDCTGTLDFENFALGLKKSK